MAEADHPPIEGWTPPSPLERRRILDDARSIAIVGASSNPARASNFVATYLLSSSADYRVYMVNPRESEILDQPVYPALDALPEVPDIVDVFRRNEELPEVAEAAAAVGSHAFWAQLGLWSSQAALIAVEAGLDVDIDFFHLQQRASDLLQIG